MRTLLLSLSLALALSGADDPWAKVRDLKSGTELKVYKKGSAQPLTVKMGELTDENLIIINGKEQTAIARETIERIDARPSGKSRITTESKVTSKDSTGDPKASIPGPNPSGGPGTTTSSGGGLSIGSKPDFETVYRRVPEKK